MLINKSNINQKQFKMKRLKFSMLLMSAIALTFFTACSDDDENINPENNCEIAIIATTQAQMEFGSATGEDYTSACTAYRAALEAQIEACGDADGSLQAIIDNLGDCTNDPGQNIQGELSVTAGTLSLDFDEISVVVEDGMVKVTGETSASNNYTIYFEVAEGATGTDIVQNFQIELTSVFYPYEEGSQYDFTSEITTNTDGFLMGSFYNLVTNDDGAELNLYNGTIDLEYQ